MTAAQPAFRRRREIGAASARSLLLTVLGEFALRADVPVWTATFLDALAATGVEEKAVRQALARTAVEGWIAAHRRGRRTEWSLTPAGRDLLTQGAARIYGFGAAPEGWRGRWLVVLAAPPETDRRLRHLLRTRLAWSGLGALQPGVWVSPHPEREGEVRSVLATLGCSDRATLMQSRLGAGEDPRAVAARAWDLAELADRYVSFVAAARTLAPNGDAEMFAAQVRLVQEWRRFPFLDPDLPVELLPPGWAGARAASLFHERHRRWKKAADRHWRALAER